MEKQRKVKYAIDIDGLYVYRQFCDGFDLVRIEFGYDCYHGDHKPSFQIWISAFNFCILAFDIYNTYHEEEQ